MPSAEQEMMDDFQRLVLETLVPLGVQRVMPQSRKFWSEIMAGKEGAEALAGAFKRAATSRQSVGEQVRSGIANKDKNILFLKNTLYQKIGNSEAAIRAFFTRQVTSANEQCPYWDGFGYKQPPTQPHSPIQSEKAENS
jgi:hypothetical protein